MTLLHLNPLQEVPESLVSNNPYASCTSSWKKAYCSCTSSAYPKWVRL
jgi:hypothetical protein